MEGRNALRRHRVDRIAGVETPSSSRSPTPIAHHDDLSYSAATMNPSPRISSLAVLALLGALPRCGGSITDENGHDSGIADAARQAEGGDVSATEDAATADVKTVDSGMDTLESSVVDVRAEDAPICTGPATFDLPSAQAAAQICQPPSCKVCVQEVDSNSVPTKWSAWQIPAQCPCPPPSTPSRDH